MKDLIRQALAQERRAPLRRLVLAEFLQHFILQSLYRHGAFQALVFTGGTALRLLYHTQRYSEDLDFSLEKAIGFRFEALLKKVQKDLTSVELPFTYSVKEVKTVARADLRFPGLLQEFRLTPMPEQKLTVKCEVDRRPPKGGTKEPALVTAPISYSVTTYDLSSLFATKLHALFFRRYTKGRDYYDLMWYLGRGIQPNFTLLNNAIRQTEGKGHDITRAGFMRKLMERLESVDFKPVRLEAERFLINPEEATFLTLPHLKSLLRHYEPL
ncbi:nucleotidyl transferase AbiEii/AbiGii toxin family protein [Candidatus Uhrbacteria bacterium]|nr:nucleotidyl transferase AbiEii/AbiGii toxin family protein [Candidatus Uhrbacteria bacterium]